MAEVLFYQLERAALEDVLPGLLEKTLERGWKALVRVGSDERAEALDEHLWTYRDDSFLAHGLARSVNAAEQPVLLSTTGENLNLAEVIFYADGTDPGDWSDVCFEATKRMVVIFDGRDPIALEAARGQWKNAKAAGHVITYWQQAATGRWEKRA